MDADAAPAERLRFRYGLPLRIAVLVFAIGLGLVAHHFLSEYLWQLEELSETDVLQARASLAFVLEIASVVVFGMTGSIGISLALSMRRSLQQERFPVSDIWSWGSRRPVVTGPRSRSLARFGLALAITLILASIAGGALTWYMAAVLRACRAGVITA
jgi:hypothetical protein